MIFKIDKGTGYMYSYSPEHPLSNKSGKVMEHTYVMSNYIGRILKKDECVHHVDRVRSNNEISNLRLMTLTDHRALHAKEVRVQTITVCCGKCSSTFEALESSHRKFCSTLCSHSNRERFSVTPERLEFLVWSMPTTKVAELLGVSDSAISKRCKRFGVTKPARGYWASVFAGYLKPGL